MEINDVLSQLSKVRRSGGRDHWVSLCPAHEDRRPSFSVSLKEGRVLFHCFSGCSQSEIRAALGFSQERPAPFTKPIRRAPPVSCSPDIASLWRRWFEETDSYHLDGFAMTLGVSTESLRQLGCAWVAKSFAWAFPMRDGEGQLIGVRLRNNAGDKWAVTGSRSGLFIPALGSDSVLYVCEGPTDVAAGLTIGLYCIGRPSCQGQEDLLTRFIRQNGVRRVVLITDNDAPGFHGAQKLQAMLRIPSCQFVTPTKDLREFVNEGGNKAEIESSIRNIVWTRVAA